MQVIEERVDRLEAIFGQFVVQVNTALLRLEKEMKEFRENAEKDRIALHAEMKEFKENAEKDRIALHAEMKEFKNEMKEFKDEMKEFKDEMKEFKDEMKEFKREVKEEHKERNKQWANLAKKMGTITEDLISPATRPAIQRYFNCDPHYKGLNILKRIGGKDYEVDIIAVCDVAVFMIEVKATPRINYVDEMTEKASHFFEFFPEYKDKKLILIMGSIVFPENVVDYASKKGIYAMAYREWDYVDILNFDDIDREQI